MSSGARTTLDTLALFGGMTKVVGRAPSVEGGRLSSLEVGANVGHLFSNVVNQEQDNTIIKGQGPSSSEVLYPIGYNDLQTKVMKDKPSSFIIMKVHRDSECSPSVHSHMYFIIRTWALAEFILY